LSQIADIPMLEVKCETVTAKFYCAYFTFFHVISSLERTGVSFIASVIWSSDLLTFDSQQNFIDAATEPSTNKESNLTACVRADGQHFEHLVW